jgi:hypothetical protein
MIQRHIIINQVSLKKTYRLTLQRKQMSLKSTPFPVSERRDEGLLPISDSCQQLTSEL